MAANESAGLPSEVDAGTGVFISYAREDRPFVERLHAALVEAGRRPWVDWEGIPASALWMVEVREAIDAAGSFCFVISPHSVESSICREEVAHAAAGNKRIVPVLRRDIDQGMAPASVAAHNWVWFREEDDFDEGVRVLLAAIDHAPEQAKAHARLLVRANEWERGDRNRSLLLRGRDLRKAERWAEEARGSELAPTQSQTAFLFASRRAASWRQRVLIGGIASALAVSVALSFVAFEQRTEAEAQARLATSRSLAAQAVGEIELDPGLALLLSVEAWQTEQTVEARDALLSALQAKHFFALDSSSTDSVAFSPDGETLATVGPNKPSSSQLTLWDAASREPLGEPIGERFVHASSVEFSPDGETLATAGSGDAVLWDVASRQIIGEVRINELEETVHSVAFSPDGAVLAAAGDGGVMLWDVASGQPMGKQLMKCVPLCSSSVTRRGQQRQMTEVAFSPDGETLATAGVGGVVLWDVASRQPLGEQLRGARPPVSSVVFSPDGETLATVDKRGVVLWDVASRQPLGEPLLGDQGWVTSVAFSPDGRSLASGGVNGSVIIWDVVTLQPHDEPLQDNQRGVSSVAFSSDGQTLATAGFGGVKLWEVDPQQPLDEPLPGDQVGVFSVTFSPDGKVLAAAGKFGVVLWDVASRRPLGDQLGRAQGPVFSVAFSPDGETLATVDRRGVMLWDLASRQPRGEVLQVEQDGYYGIAFSPDGATLAAVSIDGPVLWDVENRQSLGEPLQTKGGSVLSVAFSPESGALATAGFGWLTLWDVVTRQPLGDPLRSDQEWESSIAFDPDGEVLATAAIDGAVLWGVATGQVEGDPLRVDQRGVSGVSFSPDGTTLVTAGGDGTAALWDVSSRQLLGDPLGDPLPGRERQTSVAFGPDGTTLAVGGKEGVTLWDVGVESWVERACVTVGRNLSQAEWSQFVGPEIPYRETCSQ